MFWMEENKRHIFALWIQSKISLWNGFPMQRSYKEVLSLLLDCKSGFIAYHPDFDLIINCFLNDLINEI